MSGLWQDAIPALHAGARSAEKVPASGLQCRQLWMRGCREALPPFPTGLVAQPCSPHGLPNPEDRDRPSSVRVATSVALNRPWPMAPGFSEGEVSSQ